MQIAWQCSFLFIKGNCAYDVKTRKGKDMKVEDDFKVIENYLCIRMPKEIDHHNAGEISENADYFICHENVNSIVFDFEETEFMDSSGIGILVGRYKKIICFNGNVYVIHANTQIRKILHMSGLQRIIEIVEDK